MKRLLLLNFVFLFSCNTNNDPQVIVDQSIVASGGDKINKKEIEFFFRDKEYGASIDDGKYEYVRLFKDSLGLIRDELTNDGFTREINGKIVSIPDSMANKYSNSVNSVIYFALLPYGLNDTAVNKTYLGKKEVSNQMYHKVEITFDKLDGGKDYEDEFIYWINENSMKVDYLAYRYHTDGGGIRFRVAYNERYVEGIRFVDYINYQPVSDIDLSTIDDAYTKHELEEISRIELDKITVNTGQQGKSTD